MNKLKIILLNWKFKVRLLNLNTTRFSKVIVKF